MNCIHAELKSDRTKMDVMGSMTWVEHPVTICKLNNEKCFKLSNCENKKERKNT